MVILPKISQEKIVLVLQANGAPTEELRWFFNWERTGPGSGWGTGHRDAEEEMRENEACRHVSRCAPAHILSPAQKNIIQMLVRAWKGTGMCEHILQRERD